MQARYDAKNPARFEATGMRRARNFIAFPRDVMDASFKAAMEVYSELNAKNAALEEDLRRLHALPRDQNLWFRFAEAGFDDFMQAQKL